MMPPMSLDAVGCCLGAWQVRNEVNKLMEWNETDIEISRNKMKERKAANRLTDKQHKYQRI